MNEYMHLFSVHLAHAFSCPHAQTHRFRAADKGTWDEWNEGEQQKQILPKVWLRDLRYVYPAQIQDPDKPSENDKCTWAYVVVVAQAKINSFFQFEAVANDKYTCYWFSYFCNCICSSFFFISFGCACFAV